jgi:hypothetical protein
MVKMKVSIVVKFKDGRRITLSEEGFLFRGFYKSGVAGRKIILTVESFIFEELDSVDTCIGIHDALIALGLTEDSFMVLIEKE